MGKKQRFEHGGREGEEWQYWSGRKWGRVTRNVLYEQAQIGSLANGNSSRRFPFEVCMFIDRPVGTEAGNGKAKEDGVSFG